MTGKREITLGFHGGVGSVTGANFLLETQEGLKVLIDCGIYQGKDVNEVNREAFAYDPASIDVLVITHAHADHIGRVPKLVRDGFRGSIYSTEASFDLAHPMLDDSLKIIQEEAKKEETDPLYEEADVKHALSLWKHVAYHNPVSLDEHLSFSLHDAGHILGSAMVKFSYGTKKILFTGDLGNSPDPLLRDTEAIADVDYMLMESVYGDRNHEEREERISKLKDVVMETIAKKGILMIPSFALERTQNLLYIFNELIESGDIPKIPIYLDSPLGIRVTEIFKKHVHIMNDTVQEKIKVDPDIFSFPGLHETFSIDDSKAIMRQPNPKIIISSAGMSHAGRIIHHEKQYLDDPENILLFVGYQSVGTLGRIIQDGAQKVKLLGKEIELHAQVKTISGYSAHKDMDHLLEFVAEAKPQLKKVFVAMGETKASLFLVQRIRDYLGLEAHAPQLHDRITLSMD